MQQFDREHAGSATTGVSEYGRLQYIELPVVAIDGNHGASRLEEQLKTLPVVRKVTANASAKLVRITFDPTETQVYHIVERAKAVGYTIGAATTQIDIQGMHCASCVVTIEKALQQAPGVLTATVNPATQQAHVAYIPGFIDRNKLEQAIVASGYQVREPAATAPVGTSSDRAEEGRA